MTTKPTTGGSDGPASVPDCAHLPSLPDRPEEDHDMREALHYGYFTAMMRAYFNRYGIDAFVGNHVRVQQSVGAGYFYADCAIIFNADSERIHRRNAYVIEEFGLPPDFCLKLRRKPRGSWIPPASGRGMRRCRCGSTGGSTTRVEPTPTVRPSRETGWWRDGYEPAPLTTEGDGLIWGHSQVLGLDLCWQEGRLRVWDPVHQEYLKDPEESEEGRLAAEAEIQRLRAQLEATRMNPRAKPPGSACSG